jgi:hypothetical protein
MRAIELNAWRWRTTRPPLSGAARPRTTGPRSKSCWRPAPGDRVQEARNAGNLVARRVEFLTAYQNAAYARTYQALSRRCARRKRRWARHADRSGGALPVQADGLQGRVRGGPPAHRHSFHDRINGMFEGDFKLNYHLAPPLMAKRNAKGELQKQKFGPHADRLSSCWRASRACAVRRVRRLWPTEERQTERALITEYRSCHGAGAHSLTPKTTPGCGDRPSARADQGLWPREGPQSGGGAPQVGRLDAAMARSGAFTPAMAERDIQSKVAVRCPSIRGHGVGPLNPLQAGVAVFISSAFAQTAPAAAAGATCSRP